MYNNNEVCSKYGFLNIKCFVIIVHSKFSRLKMKKVKKDFSTKKMVCSKYRKKTRKFFKNDV